MGLSYLACVFLKTRPLSVGTINFEHVTLTVTFDLHFENFNSAHNFLTIRHRAFILGRCVFYDKAFPMILKILST